MGRLTSSAFFLQRRQTCKGFLSLGLGLVACEDGGGLGAAPATTGTTDVPPEPIAVVPLPAPQTDGFVPLESVLANRRSVRSWATDPLTIPELGQLAWAAQGITASLGRRTAPSAGALYPLELYVLTADGVHHYLPGGHRMAQLSVEDVRERVPAQGFVGAAAAIFIVTAIFARTEPRYGDDAARFVYLEAGHVAQNLLLQATALGFGAVPVGAFDALRLTQLVGLPSDHEPIYLIAVGTPAPGDGTR
jgi:SagB-type dehydrogenase family enzyme